MADRDSSGRVGDRAVARAATAVAAVTTWRYLRLAMVAHGCSGWPVAVLYEAVRVEGCWQTSISAYYYTPVQSIFVGALVTIGVCLIACEGPATARTCCSTSPGSAPRSSRWSPPPTPVTAAGPTDAANRPEHREQRHRAARRRPGCAARRWRPLSWLNRGRGEDPPRDRGARDLGTRSACPDLRWRRRPVVFLDRRWFDAYSTHVAAIPMFGFVFLNVCLNAVATLPRRRTTDAAVRRLNRYTAGSRWSCSADAVLHGCALAERVVGTGCSPRRPA